MAAKAVGIVTVLISVPLTIKYLGTERFGLWMTISSITAFLSFADFGIGGGLLNAIAEADGRSDRVAARKAFSSAFVFLALVALLILGCFGAFHSFLPWPRLFKVTSGLAAQEAGAGVAIFVVCFALNLPLTTVQRVQMGFQEGFQSSLWQGAGSLAGLAGILIVIHLRGGLPWLVLASSGGPLVAGLVNWAVEFGWHRPWLAPRLQDFDTAVTRQIAASGIIFAALQLLSFLGSASDNFVITQLFGVTAVAGYAVVTKLFSAMFIIQAVIVALWPAFGEALARNEFGAAARMFDRFSTLCTMTGIAIAICFAAIAKPLIALWVGDALVPRASLIIGFGAWIIVASLYAPVAALLSTESLLKRQLGIISLAAISAFILKVVLGYFAGVPGVIWGTVIGYGAFFAYARRQARVVLQPR